MYGMTTNQITKVFLKSGIKNICHSRIKWKYLVFYDIDRPLTQEDLDIMDNFCKMSELSYMLYKSNHGFHLIILTPVNAINWAYIFTTFSAMFNSYYSGSTLRWKLQKDEIQELIICNTTYGEVLPNLYNLFCTRFKLTKMYWSTNPKEYEEKTGKLWYGLVFENYRSTKQ